MKEIWDRKLSIFWTFGDDWQFERQYEKRVPKSWQIFCLHENGSYICSRDYDYILFEGIAILLSPPTSEMGSFATIVMTIFFMKVLKYLLLLPHRALQPAGNELFLICLILSALFLTYLLILTLSPTKENNYFDTIFINGFRQLACGTFVF